MPLTNFANSSILDLWLGSEHALLELRCPRFSYCEAIKFSEYYYYRSKSSNRVFFVQKVPTLFDRVLKTSQLTSKILFSSQCSFLIPLKTWEKVLMFSGVSKGIIEKKRVKGFNLVHSFQLNFPAGSGSFDSTIR